ncbi:uncharacterized protein TRIVIDRAFT_43790 [Trichoderma virens Gv29-8]|uniref:FAD dependent oxidoreductase domain-containing protein n=1 Tax=Hypocrea virens (strain Gv29-8 / FGSC 10586) TaxID=413071 RepID=G9N2U6_HYPVG|nr:uncharacterized protein TRIVIDRAFT_43790 [Trichoderma virens Gv29-8]EHK19005.1 hypothetical protein TRIVIDRAFT_43790 [Trichoderma virens Gv29-8]
MANTVILGSGVIGLSTAYYLLQHQPGDSIHLVDSANELFASASGFAGGFLAKDWFRPELMPLAELSFEEHRKLAEEENGRERWGYAKSVTVSYEPNGPLLNGKRGEDWLLEGTSRAGVVDSRREHQDGEVPGWLRRVDGDSVSVIDDGSGTAIVDPLRFCKFLLEKVKAAGVHIHNPASASRIETDEAGKLSGVTTCHSVYTTMDALSPEVYSRTDGVIYVAGVNHASIPLPKPTVKAVTFNESIEKLKNIARRLIATPNGEDLEIVREGLCFRPITKRGTPYIARLPEDKLGEDFRSTEQAPGGVFIASGHGPWGISLSLGTGKVVAEMMSGKPLSADISSLGF